MAKDELELVFGVYKCPDAEEWYAAGSALPGLHVTGGTLAECVARVIPAWKMIHECAPNQVPPPPVEKDADL